MTEAKQTAAKAEEAKAEEVKSEPVNVVKDSKGEGIFGGVVYHNNPVEADLKVDGRKK